MLRAALLVNAAALATGAPADSSPPPPHGPLTASAEVVSSNSDGSTGGNSIARFSNLFQVHCFESSAGVACRLLYRGTSGELVAPTPASSDAASDDYLTVIAAGATLPTVASFDYKNGVVCYRTAAEELACTAIQLNVLGSPFAAGGIKLVSGTSAIEKGTELVVTPGQTAHFPAVETWSARAPVAWAARRALVCYLLTGDDTKPGLCKPLGLEFPTFTSTKSGMVQENANVPGTLTAGTAATVVAGYGSGADDYQNYPGPRFYSGKYLTTFDHFNAMVCYSAPIPFVDYRNACDDDPNLKNWMWGSASCTSISTDLATGMILTVGANHAVPGDDRKIDVTVKAFASKSGDPTRALYCATAVTGDSTGRCRNSPGSNPWATSRRQSVTCGVITRMGTNDFTFTNQERDEQGQPTAGVVKSVSFGEAVNIEPNDPTPELDADYTRPADVSIGMIDEYNALVCYVYGYQTRLCSYPPSSFGIANNQKANFQCSATYPAAPNSGDDGITQNPGRGVPMCAQIWITGYGSSTYNSDDQRFLEVFDQVASAAAPTNVGIVTALVSGPAVALSTSETAGNILPSPFYNHKSGVCFTVDGAAHCSMVTTSPATGTWAFNAPVDCVNGFNCPDPTAAVRNHANPFA